MFASAVILIILITPLLQCKVLNRIITTLNHTKIKHIPVLVSRTPALPGQVPYIVVIKEPAPKNEVNPGAAELWFNMCAGSIIDESRVLTAAHCFEYENFTYVQDPGRLRVVAGNQIDNVAQTDYVQNDDEYFTTQWRRISEITIHEHFHFPNNDIAMLQVYTPFTLNGDVGYIQPAMQSEDSLSNCLSAGYANMPLRDDSNNTAPTVMVTTISIIPSSRCSDLWDMNMSTFVCTESAVKDMTGLDMGGPLVCTKLLTSMRQKNDHLEGIVSGRASDRTALYTRVSEYYDWLLENGYYDHNSVTVLNYNLFMHFVFYVILNYFF